MIVLIVFEIQTQLRMELPWNFSPTSIASTFKKPVEDWVGCLTETQSLNCVVEPAVAGGVRKTKKYLQSQCSLFEKEGRRIFKSLRLTWKLDFDTNVGHKIEHWRSGLKVHRWFSLSTFTVNSSGWGLFFYLVSSFHQSKVVFLVIAFSSKRVYCVN